MKYILTEEEYSQMVPAEKFRKLHKDYMDLWFVAHKELGAVCRSHAPVATDRCGMCPLGSCCFVALSKGAKV